MRTKAGATIQVDPTISSGSVMCGYTAEGEGCARVLLAPEDALDLMEETLARYEDYEQNFQTYCMSLCIRFIEHNGYVIRKAGC